MVFRATHSIVSIRLSLRIIGKRAERPIGMPSVDRPAGGGRPAMFKHSQGLNPPKKTRSNVM